MESTSEPGIIDIQLYIPRYYIDQNDLEEYDKVGKGKYTVGLGQEKMSFVTSGEDINSICLTVLEMILSRNRINKNDVGRMEVGTETFLDKSKSIKTFLMSLFPKNKDIEGVTTSNACYGGTNALLNAYNWINSRHYNGKYAIVIMADVAVYEKGNARPTGGCGAVAILLGRNANIIIESVRSTYINHVYDFYKPNPSSEYPIVDGVFSLECYLKALLECYRGYLEKSAEMNIKTNLSNFDFFCFHSPFSKMVEKAFIHLVGYDLNLNNENLNNETNGNPLFYTQKKENKEFLELKEKFKGNDLDLKAIMNLENYNKLRNLFSNEYKNLVSPGQYLNKNMGNIYTGSLYMGILALIINNNINLMNKRVLMYSYGSGCAATLFVLRIRSSSITEIRERNIDVITRLGNRIRISPKEFENIMSHKEKLYNSNNYIPYHNIEDLFENTYYLEKVDEKWRRYYSKYSKAGKSPINFNKLSNNPSIRRLEMIRNHLKNANSSESSINIYANLPSKTVFDNNVWSGFYKKSIYEKIIHVSKIHKNLDMEKLKTGGLDLIRADSMIENCIGLISIPVGLGLNFLINGKHYSVPMALEEPSVIAAVSNAAKLISENKGFFCFSDPNIMISQIHIVDTNVKKSKDALILNKEKIVKYANQCCQKMVQRGGGVKNLFVRILEEDQNSGKGKIVLDLLVDVCDSMGANLLNTIAEFTSIYIEGLIEGKIILKILSNLSIFRKSTAEFKIPFSNLKYKNISGEEIAKRIIYAYSLAYLDHFRATTHNKGIMNGIDSVALALGQDWRAIEASAHSYATLDKNYNNDRYKPLTYFKIIEVNDTQFLYGSLTLPISCGVVGGAINSNDNYKNMYKLLGNPNSQELSQIMVSVGLAQNFAALRALVSEGIQKGHMSLHARNIAIRAGVPDRLVGDVVNFMKINKTFTEECAKNYIESHNLFFELRNGTEYKAEAKKLSTLFVELDYNFLKEPISMNILLNTSINPPINLCINSRKVLSDDIRVDEIYHKLVGKSKNYDWLHEFLKFMNDVDFGNYFHFNQTNSLKYKLKLIIILLNLISYNLLTSDFEKTKIILELLITQDQNTLQIQELITKEPIYLNYGLTLLNELNEIFKFLISSYVTSEKFKNLVIKEVFKMFQNFIILHQLWNDFLQGKQFNYELFDAFFNFRTKRLNASIMFLIDTVFLLEGNINEEYIEAIMMFGHYCEIKATIWRDLYKNAGDSDINSFEIFKSLNKNVENLENLFLVYKKDELNSLKNSFTMILKNEKEKIFISKLDSMIEKYYTTVSQKPKL